MGKVRPASPGTAAWTQTACRWCVLLSILCPPVHDMLKCPPVPTPGTPKLPADCVLVLGNGLSCVVRHGAGKKLSVFAYSGGSCELALCSGRRDKCGEKVVGRLGHRLGHWLGGSGGRLPPASITVFSVCLSLFFPFALSVSSLLIRSPNSPAFTVEKPDTQVSGASGAAHMSSVFCTRSAHLVGGDGRLRGRQQPAVKQVWIPNHTGLVPRGVGVAMF